MRIKIEPRLLREIIRLHYGSQLSTREIAISTGVSRNSINRLKKHLQDRVFDVNCLNSINDVQFYKDLGLSSYSGFHIKAYPDWGWVHSEMHNPHVTLEMLWHEWRETEPHGVAYSQFVAGYRKSQKNLPLVMRQTHTPGEKLFLDFAGQTISIHEGDSVEPRYAQIFVAVLGYSNYTFAHAVWSQRVKDWLTCHVQALKFLGGVPKILVPDNLKAAVIKHGKDEISLNIQYQQLAQHYQTIILPARPRKPKDKAKVETGVKLIQRWLLSTLRHQRFFSLEELNQAIANQLFHFNQKNFKKSPNESRTSLFQSLEQQTLKPLPEEHYEPADWRFKVRVRNDYLVEYDKHHYSVPNRLVQQQVDMRATSTAIEIFHNNLRVCSHIRKHTAGITITNEHRPKNHQYYAESDPTELLAWGEKTGDSILKHLQYHLTKRTDVANGYKAASALRKEARTYGEERLEEACAYALSINTFALKSLRSILKEQPDKRPRANAVPVLDSHHENLRGASYFIKEEDI